MSEIVRCSRFSSGTSSCPGDGWVWPKGGSVVVLQERQGWRGPCLSAAVCEGVRAAEWGGERVNGWLSEGREQIRRSLTDREGSYSDQHRSHRAGPPHTHTHAHTPQPRPVVVAPPTSGAQPDAGLSSLHDCISGQIFYLIPDKVLGFFFFFFVFFLATITPYFSRQLTVAAFYFSHSPPWSGGLGWSQDFSPNVLANIKRFLNISFTVCMGCAF